ncbi:MAG: hypothetical protein OEX83_09880, partial [Gammaproteobacteria bacterium]|nr:hypothetical protein [Gammaproteobacteria bacterium]
KAPSADNSQPWLYQRSGNTLQLHIDPSRSGSISDNRFVLSDLAIGAVIENICQQAHALSFKNDVQYLPAGASSFHAATIDFSEAITTNSSLADSIHQRRTDRTFPWKGPVTDTVRELLTAEAKRSRHNDLYWATDKKIKSAFIKIMSKAERLRYINEELHDELFGSICWDKGWQGFCDEGLSLPNLAVEPPARPFFSLMRNWSVQKVLNLLGASYTLALRSVVIPCRLSPGLCLLTTDDTSRTGIIETGRALQRVWLQATSQGLAIQPFAAAGIYSLGYIKGNEKLVSACSTIGTQLKDLTKDKQGIIFLRLGYSRSPITGQNHRRAKDSFNLPTS